MTSVVFERDALDDLVGEMLPDAVDLRREIHKHPELGTDNPETQRRILEALHEHELGLEISTGTTLTSVTADLVGARPPRRSTSSPASAPRTCRSSSCTTASAATR